MIADSGDPGTSIRPNRPGQQALAGLKADLHIHSVLSPCAEREMTPGNIVGMAIVLGLDIIAITDHQSCGNCEAAIAISEALGGPLVIPGMEAESAEEIHLLCLFPDLASAKEFELYIRSTMPDRPNRKDIFGEQWVMDDQDECVREEERMLLIPSRLTCDEIAAHVIGIGGVCIPAHLDREANSMLISLGAVPPDFPTSVIELSSRVDPARFFRQHPELDQYRYITNSDAHRLETMAVAAARFVEKAPDIAENDDRNRSRKSITDVIQALRPGMS